MATLDQDTLHRLVYDVWPALEQGFNLPPGILHAIAWWETRGSFRTNDVSPKGARGLFQIMPIAEQQVKNQFGFTGDAYNPYISSMLAAALLSRYTQRFRELPLILIAYNAGEGNAVKYLKAISQSGVGQLPLETVNYVRSVREFLGR